MIGRVEKMERWKGRKGERWKDEKVKARADRVGKDGWDANGR